jgi:isopenicillin N synthase-like dioxygenase
MTTIVDTPNVPDQTTFDEARHGAEAYLRSRLLRNPSDTDINFSVPVIDISSSFSSLSSARQAVASQIRSACITSGFFYITGHQIPESACKGILHQADRFMHELNLEQKEELHLKKSKYGLGWEPSDYTSIAGDKEQKEVFNFAYEEGLDPTGGDGAYRNLDGTKYKANLWPSEESLPGFYAEVKEYYAAVCIFKARTEWRY